MIRKTLKFVIEKSMNTIQKGTFTVPSVCQRLCLEYDLKEPYTFLIFMLVKNPKGIIRFQKQLGYSEPVICIGQSERDTTIGGIPGEIEPGDWTVETYVFAEHVERMAQEMKIPFTVKVSDEERTIREKIGGPVWVDEAFDYRNYDMDRYFQKETGWYKGDFHTHTQLSDGKELPERANEKAKLMNLDYYVATEHNVLHTGWPETDVMIMPGVEVTTILGHANLFGIDKRPEKLTDILWHKDEKSLAGDLEGIIEECKKRDWLFSINHPFLYIWKWLYEGLSLEKVNCLEINNDPTYEADPDAGAKEANQKAVFLSDLLWADGYRICAIGGSDSHKEIDDFYPGATEPSIPGDPATYLYMEGLSPANVLDSLKKCHCYVIRHGQIDSEFYVLDENGKKIQNVIFGDILTDRGRVFFYRIRIVLTGSDKAPEIYYIENGRKTICDSVKIGENTYCAEGKIELEQRGYQWIRFGADDSNGEFMFYGNPITKGNGKHRFHTFGEIRKNLEEQWQSEEFYLTKTEH